MLLKVGNGKLSIRVSDVLRGHLAPHGVSPVGMITPVALPAARWPLYYLLFKDLSRSICEVDLIHGAFPSDLLPSLRSAGIPVRAACKL